MARILKNGKNFEKYGQTFDTMAKNLKRWSKYCKKWPKNGILIVHFLQHNTVVKLPSHLLPVNDRWSFTVSYHPVINVASKQTERETEAYAHCQLTSASTHAKKHT